MLFLNRSMQHIGFHDFELHHNVSRNIPIVPIRPYNDGWRPVLFIKGLGLDEMQLEQTTA
jgi:hypothetical protein